jgi:hypothetical protein
MMSRTDAEKVVGILVAGVNPRHELDDNYKYDASSLRPHSQVTLAHILFFLVNRAQDIFQFVFWPCGVDHHDRHGSRGGAQAR